MLDKVYNKDEKPTGCIKCGNRWRTVKYCDGKICGTPCSKITQEEHLHLICEKCGFEWLIETIDNN